MKKYFVPAVLLFLVSFLFSQEFSARKSVDSFRLKIEGFTSAYNRNDTTALASFYVDTAQYVSPHVPNLIIRGRKAIVDNFRNGIAMGGHIDSVIVLSEGSSGDLSYLVCRYVATNNGVTVNGRNILIMKKIDGEWMIVTHASIIKD